MRKVKDPVPRAWVPYVLLSLAGLLVYGRVLFFDYVYLDDNALILGNGPFLRSWGSVFSAFRQDVFHVMHGPTAYYRPLFMVSLIVDAHVSGMSPWGYHLTSLLVHLAASCLFYRLLEKLGHGEGISLSFALAFAVSPVLAQAVALIPDRDDSMLGLFALGAFLFFLRYRETQEARHLWLHLLCFALAVFSKETGVVLVPALILSWPLLLGDRTWTSEKGRLLSGWGAVGVVWYLLRRQALPNPISVGLGGALESIWLGLPSVVQSVGKILLPFDLSVLPFMRDIPMIWGGLALLLTAMALFAAERPRWSRVLFGACWFMLFLLPSMTLHSTTFADVMMEKRLYVPLMGFILILMETGLPRLGKAGLALLAVYACLAWRHGGDFRDRMTFWRSAARTSPHLPLAHRNLGAMFYLDGVMDQAALEFQKAADLNPVEPMVHNNLGLIHMNNGLFKEAEVEYRKELAINPGYDNALFNLGLLCYRQGRLVETEALWIKTLESNPDHADAYRDLAVLYSGLRKPDQAGYYLREGRRRGLIAP